MSGEHTLIERLAQHLQRPVPENVRTRARLHLLDWLACVAGARQTAVAHVVFAAEPDALFRSAYLGNVLEMDDVHRGALLHAGPIVWPAALRAGTLTHALVAAVRGYEAAIAVGASFDQYHYAHWHPTSTAGVFGATAAVCSAEYGNGEVGLIAALGNAGSVAGGLWHMRHDNVMTKQWHVAHAIRTAIEIAHLADCCLSGPAAILEGQQGLYQALTREPKPLVLGEGWRIEEVSFKPWAACRHAHPAIDCALELRTADKLDPPFHVETYQDALTFCDRPNPITELDAKFSLQHAVAVIASGGAAEPADFTLEAIARLAPLRAKVSVAEAPEITARYPAHFGARVNGLELADCRGDPERPVGETDVVAKMRMLAEWGGLPASEADRAAELALRGDDPQAIVAMLEDWLA